MAEPVSSAAVGASAAKMVGFGGIMGVAFFFVAAVVLMTRMPRSSKEWAVMLISTLVSSLGIGSGIVVRYNLQHLAQDWFGMVFLGGVIFVCGLPGWFLVRLWFNYVSKHDNADITDVIRDIKKIKDEVQK